MSQPAVAVVVIGRNEATKLGRCFASVRAFDYPADLIELIYVDSGSSDNSIAIARRCGARVISLTEPPFSAARGRDVGWRATTAPYVLFVDGDCEIASGFVSRALTVFADPKVAVIFGQLAEYSSGDSFIQDNLAMQFHGLPVGPSTLMGGNHLNRRSALEDVDGYDTYWESMENADLGRRLWRRGYLVVRIDEPMALHHSRICDWRRLLRRGFRYGYGDSRFMARFPSELLRYRDYACLGPRFTDLFLFLVTVAVLPVSLYFWSAKGIVLWVMLFPVLILFKAWRSRRKTTSWTRRLQFGLFTQLFCPVIASGHLAFWYDALRGASREIDYWRVGENARSPQPKGLKSTNTDTAES